MRLPVAHPPQMVRQHAEQTARTRSVKSCPERLDRMVELSTHDVSHRKGGIRSGRISIDFDGFAGRRLGLR